jgi:hypothetical protein
VKERIVLKLIRWLLLLIPYYGIAYKENIAGENQRVYKARKRRKDAGIRITRTKGIPHPITHDWPGNYPEGRE